jgi:hypothetical protein
MNRQQKQIGGNTMFANLNLSSRLAAAVSAFGLSLAMIAGTVSVPSQAHSAQFASAYVSVLA